MLRAFLSLLFEWFTRFRAAEATVITFMLVSLIGGWLLYQTEHARIVHAKQPIHTEVVITTDFTKDENIISAPRHEIHTFIKDVDYKGERFIDMLFTAVSALCVTGLISTDFSQFTLPGQIIVLVLIQIGGLGIILATSIFAVAAVRGFSEHENFHTILSGVLDTPLASTRRMLKYITLYTLLFEFVGFLIMGIRVAYFYQDTSSIGNLNPWWWAMFHSVSAFNNAGFGLLNNNLMSFVADPVINLVIACLIILGGIGYPVLIAIHTFIRGKFFLKEDAAQAEMREAVKDVTASSVQTRIAIGGTIVLLAGGTLAPLLFDWNNPALAGFTLSQKILILFFQSASTRTAGFNTVDIGTLSAATTFLYMGLMFVGANPAGTAGGIKIPTVAVLYGYLKDWFKKPGEAVTLFGRRISKFALSHAIRLYFFSTLTLVLVALMIFIMENEYITTPDPIINLHKLGFEIVSAFGTVGMSMGFPGAVTSLSAILTPFSKALIIFLMLFGRLGPLTVLAALPIKREAEKHPLTPDFENAEKIQIG